MAVDSKYKGNRTLKDAGQKPQNAEDKEYVEMIQQQTTFEAAAEGGDFRYSENYQNFDPSKKDYPDLEYTYPPFNPPPFDPWPPGPVPPKDDPPGGDITNEFGCTDPTFCWCPEEEKCGTVSCTQTAVAAQAVYETGEYVYCRNNRLCITASNVSSDPMQVEIVMQKSTKLAGGQIVRQQARDIVSVKKCEDSKCCGCKNSKISYTTNAMNISETQNLSATKITDACKTKAKLTWTASNGSISPSTGRDVVYTAPATNLNCDESADITLYCDGKVIDTLHITVNASGTGMAVVYNTCYSESGGCATGFETRVKQQAYNCDGSDYGTIYCSCIPCSGSTPPAKCAADPCIGLATCEREFAQGDNCAARGVTANTCADIAEHLTTTRPNCGDGYGDAYFFCQTGTGGGSGVPPYGAGSLNTYTDVRSTAQKNAGCCPPQLS